MTNDMNLIQIRIGTPTTKDRFALIRPIVIDGNWLDIRMRMIQIHELQAAQGFGSEYRFAGNKGDIIRQIGNAVEVNIARALCNSLLSGPKPNSLDQWAS